MAKQLVAVAVKSGSAIVLDCPCGLKHIIQRIEKTNDIEVQTKGEIKDASDLDYLFEKEEEGE